MKGICIDKFYAGYTTMNNTIANLSINVEYYQYQEYSKISDIKNKG